ncbi:MAG TPA: S4 domain-containing protein, partial [Planctomycetota bacterium]|nr:S4 domain-containing protein [Planctomycetota bacterium]
PARAAELLAGPPRDGKAALAAAVVERYHGAEAAAAASAEFDRMFRDKGLPDDIPEIALPEEPADGEGGAWIVRALTHCGLAESSSAARRLLRDGGVRVDGARITDEQLRLPRGASYLVQAGKRRFVRVRVP